MKTTAWEIAPQIALRNCSKAAVGEGQYTRFWWRGSSGQSSTYFIKRFLLVLRSRCHMKGFSAFLGRRSCKIGTMKSVPENIQLSKNLLHQLPWSRVPYFPPWIPFRECWRVPAVAAQAGGKCLWSFSRWQMLWVSDNLQLTGAWWTPPRRL